METSVLYLMKYGSIIIMVNYYYGFVLRPKKPESWRSQYCKISERFTGSCKDKGIKFLHIIHSVITKELIFHGQEVASHSSWTMWLYRQWATPSAPVNTDTTMTILPPTWSALEPHLVARTVVRFVVSGVSHSPPIVVSNYPSYKVWLNLSSEITSNH